MRVLLCLLSDQHVPNLLSVHQYLPDRLVLVQSRAMEKRDAASNLLAALKLGGLDYGNEDGQERSYIARLEHEDDLDDIRRTLREAYSRYPGAEWVVNVTGGMKPMSIAAYDFFSGLIRRGILNGRLVYMNVSDPGKIVDLDTREAEPFTHRLSTKQFLAGYGFESRKADTKLDAGEVRARCWFECARTIAAAGLDRPAITLNETERRRAREKGLDLEPHHLASADPEALRSLADTFSLEFGNGTLRGRVDKYAVQFLTGGWLEILLWGILDRHASQLGIWDVRLGLEVGRKGDATGNDFDISFMRKNGLCMIECKSGSQAHDPGADILYKIEAVIRQFRALRVQSWLATTSTNVFDPRSGQVKANIANRAAIHGCRLILRDDIAQLAAASDDKALADSLFFHTANNR